MELIPLYILILEVIIITIADRWLYGTFITPSIILMVPYLFIVLIIAAFGNQLGLVSFNYKSLFVWIVGILPMWSAGILLKTMLPQRNPASQVPMEIPGQPWIRYFFTGVVAVLFLKFLLVIRSGIPFGSKEFGESFIGGGLFGHLSNFLFILFPYFVLTTSKKSVFYNFIKILVLIFVLSYWSKTWFLTVLICTVFILVHSGRIRLSFWTVIFPVIGGFFFFVMFYSFTVKDNLMSFAVRHFIDYLTSGILPLSEYMKLPHFTEIDAQYVFSPFINFYNTLLGKNLVEVHSEIWITTDVVSNFESNVFSFFGTIYMYSGIWYGILLSFALGLINYSLLIRIRSSHSVFIAIAYFNSMAIFFWGWFNCTYVLLRPWEILLLALVMNFLATKVPEIRKAVLVNPAPSEGQVK